MITVLDEMMKLYNHNTIEETKGAFREIIQSVILVGLSKAGFFEYASFYGGTALRLFYGLNRYSEDLDFTLNKILPNFSLDSYFDEIKKVAESYGLVMEIQMKQKKINTPIESAFAKLNTYETLLFLKISPSITNYLHKEEVLKVKIEVDTNPSLDFGSETKWIDLPEYAPIVVLDEPSLFAGKIHAILCRTYKNHVKGRDYYDFLYFIKKGISPNIPYLKNKLVDSNVIKEKDEFNISVLKEMLITKIQSIDFKEILDDANRFILNNEDLSIYSKELFIDMVKKIK